MTIFSKKAYDKCSHALHPWTTSCSLASLGIFYHIFRSSFKIYGTLYLVATLLKRKRWGYVREELLYEVLRSTTFLSINGFLFLALLCFYRQILGAFTVLTGGLLPAALASYFAIIVERPERRGLLALYMFNNALESIFNAMVSRNIITKLSYGEIYMFCVATGLLMYLYRTNKLNNGFLNKIIKFLLGEDKSNSNCSQNQCPITDIYKRLLIPVKAFSVGYLMEVVPGILKSLFRPLKVPRILMSRSNLKLGLFLSSFVSIFQFVEYLSTIIRKKQDPLNSLIAGVASGSSMICYRSSTISLYLFTKVFEVIFKNAQYQGVIPFVPYADIIMYTLSTAVTLHMCAFESHNVRPSYLKFLNHISNNRFKAAMLHVPRLFTDGDKNPSYINK